MVLRAKSRSTWSNRFFERPVPYMKCREVEKLGASLLRRVGLGVYPDLVGAHSPRFAPGYPLPYLALGANSSTF